MLGAAFADNYAEQNDSHERPDLDHRQDVLGYGSLTHADAMQRGNQQHDEDGEESADGNVDRHKGYRG